jgi:anti-anti-sigma factor
MSLTSSCSTPSDAQEPLPISADHDSDAATTRMIISGEIDSVSCDEVRTAVLQVLRTHRPAHIEMDLRGVTFLDSAGIKMLIQCQSDARPTGCRITLTETSHGVYRILEITGLLDHFDVPVAERS